MPTPRIPPLRIIESRPAPMLRPITPAAYPAQGRSHLLGFCIVFLAFGALLFGLVSSEMIYPSFYQPIFSALAMVLTFPLILLGVVKLA